MLKMKDFHVAQAQIFSNFLTSSFVNLDNNMLLHVYMLKVHFQRLKHTIMCSTSFRKCKGVVTE